VWTMDTRSEQSYETTVTDVEYASHGGKPLLARIYRPVGKGPFPAVVDVHGGAWTSADRTQNVAIDGVLAAAGTVVMAVDFRMPPEAQYPASLNDVNLAIRWFKAHAEEYGTRPELIGGLGTSSGGQQLMTNVLRPRDPRFAALPLAGNVTADLAFVVLAWPVADPLARYRMAKEKGLDRLVAAHNAFFPTEAAMAEGNPQHILDRGEATSLPPTLILQGTNDDNLTPDMSDRFAAAYAKAGGSVQLEKFPGEPHTFISKDPNSAASLRALALMKAFIRKQAA
jgi:acetyl esterase